MILFVQRRKASLEATFIGGFVVRKKSHNCSPYVYGPINIILYRGNNTICCLRDKHQMSIQTYVHLALRF